MTQQTRPTPARLVIVGECNSGKTWLANTLLGTQVLPSSFVTRTELPTLVEFGARRRLALEKHDRSRVPARWEDVDELAGHGRRLRVRLPLPELKLWRLIDTPGLGHGDECGDQRTRRACRDADLVLWCTSALQAWKASEQNLWLSLPVRARKNGVLVLTFTDMLRLGQDAHRILTRLHAEAGLHFQRIVVPSQLKAVLADLTRGCEGRACVERPAPPDPISTHPQFAPAFLDA